MTVDEYADLAAKLTVPNDDVTQTGLGRQRRMRPTGG